MYDGLELGVFTKRGDKLELLLNENVKKSWLPYIFELALDKDRDMRPILDTWIKERVFPRNRFGARKMLKQLGLKKYNVYRIAEVTRCSLVTDPYWLAYEYTDNYEDQSVRGQLGLDTYPYNSIGVKDEENYTWRTAQKIQ